MEDQLSDSSSKTLQGVSRLSMHLQAITGGQVYCFDKKSLNYGSMSILSNGIGR